MIIKLKDLNKLRQKYPHKKIVLGSGVFDLIHCGHVHYLKRLKKYGDIVVVMVKSDDRVRTGKGIERPILSERDRIVLVDAIKDVDFTFISSHYPHESTELDPVYKEVFDTLHPDTFYSTNPKWKSLEGIAKTKVIVEKRNTKAPLRSTTKIIKYILSKYKQGTHD